MKGTNWLLVIVLVAVAWYLYEKSKQQGGTSAPSSGGISSILGDLSSFFGGANPNVQATSNQVAASTPMGNTSMVPATPPLQPRICPAWGCGTNPITVIPGSPTGPRIAPIRVNVPTSAPSLSGYGSTLASRKLAVL